MKRADTTGPEPTLAQLSKVGATVFEAVKRDRSRRDGMIVAHSAQALEELYKTMQANPAVDLEAQMGVSEVLERIRNRVFRFTISAQSQLQKRHEAKSAHVAKPSSHSAPMTMHEDASRVLRTLAEYGKTPDDARRGRHQLDGDELAEAIRLRWGAEMSADRINDAAGMLESQKFVELGDSIGGNSDYEFSSVVVTRAGRHEHQKSLQRLQSQIESETAMTKPTGTKIFFGHGGSPVWRDFRDYVHHRLHLPCDEYGQQATAGYTIQERLTQMLDDAAFAFLVMTAEDETAEGAKVARANVVHEVGLFQGRLGFKKAIVLLENGCAEFSNIHGVSQIRFDKDNVKAAFDEIRQTLEREGLIK